MNRVRVLVMVDWYEPGFKGGGITRSAINFVNLFKDDFEIFVLTTNSDFGVNQPYSGISSNEWTRRDGVSIYYAEEEKVTYSFIAAQIKSIDPQVIYLNSMFSFRFAILPSLLKGMIKFRGKILLAPRGSLKNSALSTKAPKKQLFLFLFKLAGLHKRIHFQATDAQEYRDVQKVFGDKVKVSLIPDLPTLNIVNLDLAHKEAGQLKLVFVGRAHPIKNMDFLLTLLERLKEKISLDVVVTREDIEYLGKCKSMVQVLPPNISVTIHEDLPHAEVLNILASSHVFILPTKGENFGHAIFEALFIGVPVIISDQTPWRNLSEAKAGYVCPLEDQDSYARNIQYFHRMDKEEFALWRSGAKNYAKKFLQENQVKEIYRSVLC